MQKQRAITAFLTTSILALTPSAFATLTLDWSTASSAGGAGVTQIWNYGDGVTSPETLQATDGMGGTHNVSFSFSGGPPVDQIMAAGTIEQGMATPLVTSTSVSGFGDGLLFRIDPPDTSSVSNPTADPVGGGSTNLPLVLTISFPSGPVFGLNFELGDIDLQNVSVNAQTGIVSIAQHQDQVTVAGAPFTATVPSHGFLTEGPAGTFIAQPFIDNNGNGTYDAGDTLNSVRDVPDNQTGGNVGFDFPGPVSNLTISFEPGPDSPDTVFTQWISLSDLTFTTVPEPSAFLFMGLIGVGTLGFHRMRKSRELAE